MKTSLVCPLDFAELTTTENGLTCQKCGQKYGYETVDGKQVIDLRATDVSTVYQVKFKLPQQLLAFKDIHSFGRATNSPFEGLSRGEVLKKFGTKLHKESMFYLQELLSSKGGGIRILDLGCGNGGTKRYLQGTGFTEIVSVDYWSSGAEYLIDAHRLPFADASFDLIVTTATLEHFANPFVAFKEMSRVLSPGGSLIATGSFWESWHGQSCFHFTPGGMYQLCESSQFELKDMWPGWGFIPSTLSHATGTRKLKPLFFIWQNIFNAFLRLAKGRKYAFLHSYRTAGSLGIYAIKSVN
ncbi:MAG: class I SAM-dependent methyltransferase [Bacteroidetes bacterium]|nr:class I SAM-dependent methyltransferase [Bacteroidota bacterium]